MSARKASYKVEDLIINRWSARAMSGEVIADDELMSLFEAARWAPSSYNNQPWRFVYAKKDTSHWQPFFDLLVEFNQGWAQHAGALLILISRKNFEFNGKPSRTHSFDAGAAWQNLALQGVANGLVIHAMEGFDYAKARELLQLSDEYTIECMIAVGKPGNTENLPADLQKREAPSERKKIEEFAFEGSFK